MTSRHVACLLATTIAVAVLQGCAAQQKATRPADLRESEEVGRAAGEVPSATESAHDVGGDDDDVSADEVPPGPPFTWRFHFEKNVRSDAAVVAVSLCFAGVPPVMVGPEFAGAADFLDGDAHVVAHGDVRGDVRGDVHGEGSKGEVLAIVDEGAQRGLRTGHLPPGSCIAYRMNLLALAEDRNSLQLARPVGRSILATPDTWLWRPIPWPRGAVGRLMAADRPGISLDDVAGAFARVDGAYAIPGSVFALQSYTALGDLARRTTTVQARGTRFDITRVDDGGLDDGELHDLLMVAIDDVAVPLGQFPVDRARILLVPVPSSRPVVAGFLGRGGGASALMLLGRGPFNVEDDPELVDEDGRWVFTHELAHALLPSVRRRDAWLNEGMTTWQQEVLPAAAGRRERALADAQLAIGFRTGRRRANEDSLTVEESCTGMDTYHSYQHCYWSGAALTALLADDVGDEGVFALIAALHRLGPIDSTPTAASVLLETVATRDSNPLARQAASRLQVLWETWRNTPFPDVPAAPVVN